MISESVENKYEGPLSKCKENLQEHFTGNENEKIKEINNNSSCSKERSVNIDDSNILKHHLAKFITPTPQLPVLCRERNVNNISDDSVGCNSPADANYKINKSSCQASKEKINFINDHTTTDENNQVSNSIDIEIDNEEDDREYNARFNERINKFYNRRNDGTSTENTNSSNTNNKLIAFNGAVLCKEKPLTVKEQMLLSQPYFPFTSSSVSPCTSSPVLSSREIDIYLQKGNNNSSNNNNNNNNKYSNSHISRKDSTEIWNTNKKSNSLANDLTLSTESHTTRLCEESFSVSLVNSAVNSILQTALPGFKSHDEEKCVSVNCANNIDDATEFQNGDGDNNDDNHTKNKNSIDEIYNVDENTNNNNNNIVKAVCQNEQLQTFNEDELDDMCNLSKEVETIHNDL